MGALCAPLRPRNLGRVTCPARLRLGCPPYLRPDLALPRVTPITTAHRTGALRPGLGCCSRDACSRAARLAARQSVVDLDFLRQCTDRHHGGGPSLDGERATSNLIPVTAVRLAGLCVALRGPCLCHIHL